MLFSNWLWWLAVACGGMAIKFCSLRRRSVVSSGPFSMGMESAPRSVMVVLVLVAGGAVCSMQAVLWLLTGDCGVLSRRDANRPFWYWARVIWSGNHREGHS